MDYVGDHTIEFKLFDLNSGRSNEGLATIKLSIIEEEDEEEVNVTINKPKPAKNESSSTLVSAKIVKVTNKGVVHVHFNEEMSTEFNLTWINKTTVDMYIEPYDEWTIDNALYREPDLNFTWTVISFEGKEL
jgi:hypothetical protein